MIPNPFVAQLIAEERIKDELYQAEQARLGQIAQESDQLWNPRLPLIFGFKSWLAYVSRPQHQQLSENIRNL